MASNFMIRCPSLHPRNPISPASNHRKSPNPFSIKRRIPGVTVSCVSKGEREILSDDERSRTVARLGTTDSTIEEKNQALEEEDGNFFGGSGVSNSRDVFEWRWPTWENLPERYKLIGTTALAFVICNMDKLQSKDGGMAGMGGNAGGTSVAENINTKASKYTKQDERDTYWNIFPYSSR